MPTSILAAAAPAIISSGVQFGASKLFGGGSESPQARLSSFSPTGVNAGGLMSSMDGSNISVTPSAERLGAVRALGGVSGELADSIRALRQGVAPGISNMRAARLAEIEDARNNAIGTLRENLQRRRVLGSSFGNDALARAEAEFGGARERVAAESFLQELEATNNLLTQEAGARRQQFQTGLDELNLEADMAAKLAGKSTEQLGANARLIAQMNAQEAAGQGKFFGQLMQPVGDALGKGIGKSVGGWFNGLSGSSFGSSLQ